MCVAVHNLCMVKMRVLFCAVLRTQLIFRLNLYQVLLAASYREQHSAHLAWFVCLLV